MHMVGEIAKDVAAAKLAEFNLTFFCEAACCIDRDIRLYTVAKPRVLRFPSEGSGP